MATWAQTKETLDQSDKLNAALKRLGDLHATLIDRFDVEGLRSLTNCIESLAAANEPEVKLPFTVVAGKFEPDGTRNYKYVEGFATLDEAQAALDKVRGYPFAEIEGPECQDQGCPARYAS